MFSVRCTKKLLSHMGATPILEERTPTTALGDWYANLIPTYRGGVVICTNERTLLTVILPLMEGDHPLLMFPMRVYNLLRLIGIPEAQADKELNEMGDVEIRKSQNRRVLGSMNDIAYHIQCIAEDAPPGPLNASESERVLAKTLFTLTKYVSPEKLVRAILCGETGQIN